MKVTTYECYFKQQPQDKIQFTRQTAGQAKAAFYEDCRDHVPESWTLKDVRAKSLGQVVDSSRVRHMGEYRNVPFVRNGMRCEVCGKMGRIVGAGGGGAYLQVQYDSGQVLYFHPQGDRCRFFDEDGNEILKEAA